jgi:hypothetical protein
MAFWPYSLVASDLCDVDSLEATLHQAGFNPALPTLFLAECVLVYLPNDSAQKLLTWAAGGDDDDAAGGGGARDGGGGGGGVGDGKGPRLFAAFEMVRPDDAFGQVSALFFTLECNR